MYRRERRYGFPKRTIDDVLELRKKFVFNKAVGNFSDRLRIVTSL